MRTGGLSILWIVMIALIGCDGVKLKGGESGVSTIDATTTWPFVPVAMVVHPFSAIEYEAQTQTYVLHARIELLDRVGDMTKGVGDFRFELYRMPQVAGLSVQEGTLEYSWDAPVTTLEQNRNHYDPITRTYLFRLKMDRPPTMGSPMVLVAGFIDPGGRRLSAEAKVTAGSAVENEVE